MVERLVECVPNVSEGRRRDTVRALCQTIADVPGVLLLDCQSDVDHNRSVITFAGTWEAVLEAAVRLAGAAAEMIDLRRQRGVHPRIGALDVLPFVPLRGATLEDCARLAVEAGEEIWSRHRIPVYLYEAAARRTARRNLADIRRGQFEGLREAVRTDARRRPDIGGPDPHPSAGATAIGARKLMIAYNVLLATSDAGIARRIARKIRFSSGGLPHVKAMGVLLDSRKQAQVSMNLTDFEVTPPHVVFEAISRQAEQMNTAVAGSEIVGLIPQKALDMAAGRDLRIQNFHPRLVLENRLAELEAAPPVE
ncbi:MAG: glutamate formimidoyltransferase [bacterium]|nr:glutamate formimidoyltransferase [bacterium]